ncbi:MAG: zf-HC2 domain-containing protein [Eubacteriales bacterium]|nr:zf-HC2 domain-containing protein [Eubacteriales bacterium]
MDCHTAEGMVNRYISHDLPVSDLEEFIDHVRGCSSCYDELQTYFIVHEATQRLDEDEEEPVLDFRELLEEDIRKSEHYILRKKFTRAVVAVGCCILIAGLGGSLLYVIMQLL